MMIVRYYSGLLALSLLLGFNLHALPPPVELLLAESRAVVTAPRNLQLMAPLLQDPYSSDSARLLSTQSALVTKFLSSQLILMGEHAITNPEGRRAFLVPLGVGRVVSLFKIAAQTGRSFDEIYNELIIGSTAMYQLALLRRLGLEDETFKGIGRGILDGMELYKINRCYPKGYQVMPEMTKIPKMFRRGGPVQDLCDYRLYEKHQK